MTQEFGAQIWVGQQGANTRHQVPQDPLVGAKVCMAAGLQGEGARPNFKPKELRLFLLEEANGGSSLDRETGFQAYLYWVV